MLWTRVQAISAIKRKCWTLCRCSSGCLCAYSHCDHRRSFFVRKRNSDELDNPKHNTYLEPTSGIDMTHISTIENDSYHTTPTEQDSYHTIPDSHFDYMNGNSNVRTNMETS